MAKREKHPHRTPSATSKWAKNGLYLRMTPVKLTTPPPPTHAAASILAANNPENEYTLQVIKWQVTPSIVQEIQDSTPLSSIPFPLRG